MNTIPWRGSLPVISTVLTLVLLISPLNYIVDYLEKQSKPSNILSYYRHTDTPTAMSFEQTYNPALKTDTWNCSATMTLITTHESPA